MMRRIIVALIALIIFSDGATRGQSVAETLAALEYRANTPLVLTRGDNEGGQLYLMDSGQQRATLQLRTDGAGGNVDLYSRSGTRSVYLGTEGNSSGRIGLKTKTSKSYLIDFAFDNDSIGNFSILDPSVEKVSTQLNTHGLFVLDVASGKSLAYFAKTPDGSAAQVVVNGTQVHDYAEVFDLVESDGVTPGDVVVASMDGKGIKRSHGAYDPTVVGVISGGGSFRPGMQIGSRNDGSSNLPVAVSGQVYVRVSDESGAIAVGDLLVSSAAAGVAMRGTDVTRLTGRVIGKALQPYSGQGESLIRMLVMAR